MVEHLPPVRMCWGTPHVPELEEVGLGQGTCAVLVQLSEEKRSATIVTHAHTSPGTYFNFQ